MSRYDFNRRFSLEGIRICDSALLALLERISRYKEEYKVIHTDSGYASNGDGALLYGMVRELRPGKVIEVGSGNSTRIVWKALQKNAIADGVKGRIISIEPYPKPTLKKLAADSKDIMLIESKVEDVDTELFESLEPGDILFIDSSHVVKIGNDVHYLYLSLLPKVPVGTIIHIHDIRFPLDYPKNWVLKAKKFWNEQYLLQMFLAFNDSFEIMFAGNYMYDKYPREMADSLVGLEAGGAGWPGCFWMKRTK
ncbi:MAG: class I SAM-dependent methyltransferase [Thermodesulfobacteriota bacterium]